jgi:septal ring factor EnvC (AmiA/AmiB activator)
MKIRAYLYVGVLLVCIQAEIFSQSLTELQQQRDATRQEIEYTSRLLDQVTESKSSSLNRIRLLDRRITGRQELIRSLNVEIDLLQERMNDNEFVIRSLTIDSEKIKSDYARLIMAAYKQRPPYFELTYVFASRDINQAYKRIKYLQQYSEYRKRQVHLILQIQDLLEKKNLELSMQRQKNNMLLAEVEQEREKLNGEIREQQNQVKNLLVQERDLRQEIREKRRIAARLEEEINRLIEEEARRTEGIAALTPEQKLVSDNFENNRGRLPWPTETGVVTEKFGEHPHPVIKNVKVRNDGINITTTENARVRAIFEGEVMRVFAIPGANQTVIIRHGNFLTVYSNLVEVIVKKGDRVESKQTIGTVFTDRDGGLDTTMNFLIYKEKEKLDPEQWLSR